VRRPANGNEEVTMNRGELVHEVRRRGEFRDAAAAEDAVLATLSVLGERLRGGEAKDLAAQLPAELADAVQTTGPGDAFDVMEFCRRVAAREEADVSTAIARRHARVVLDVVLGAVSAGERDDVLAQLPDEYVRELIGAGR
jgi:uncharacterized protein (DUF2267 family)